MKPILFIDFDSTLCFDRFWRSLESNRWLAIQDYIFNLNQSLVEDWMRGVCTSEDVNKKIAEYLNMDYQALWDIFVSDCKSMYVSQNTLNKIDELRSKYQTVLITDNMDCFDRFTAPALELDKYFDSIVNSYNEKLHKKEEGGKLFLEVCKRRGSVDIGTCILIDNSNRVCRVFDALGGKALRVDDSHSADYYFGTLFS